MSRHYLDTFKPFTVGNNSGFKLNFNGIVVSVVCHSVALAMEDMIDTENGLIGAHLQSEVKTNDRSMFDFSPMKDTPFFTFSCADVCVFDSSDVNMDSDSLTSLFVDTNSAAYDEIAGIITINSVFEFLDICNKVREYVLKKGD